MEARRFRQAIDACKVDSAHPLVRILPAGIMRANRREKEIERAMDRDTFLEADEAMKFGIVDKVFETRPENEGASADGSGGAPE